MDRKDYVGKVFGNREVIAEKCTIEDWEKVGLKVPASKSKYLLTKCLNCGSVFPSLPKNIISKPNRCVFCSGIGNFSGIDPLRNAWASLGDDAVCMVAYDNDYVNFYVDSDDYERAKSYVWRISKKRNKLYVVTGSFKKGTMMYLHELIYGDNPDGLEIDHIDGDSLNNRKSNLRLATRQENVDNQLATRSDNKLGIRGVCFAARDNIYKVDFNYHGKRFYVKPWKTIEEAVWCRYCFEQHYHIPALEHNPQFAKYNTLSQDEKDTIHSYVQSLILGNER